VLCESVLTNAKRTLMQKSLCCSCHFGLYVWSSSTWWYHHFIHKTLCWWHCCVICFTVV